VKLPPTCLGIWKKTSRSSLVYLASPYSHPDPAVQEERFQAVCRAASHLMQAGLRVFSPIAHSHPISLAGSLPTGWEYWEAYDEFVLSACGVLAILQLDGWNSSRGIKGEVEIARRLGLVTYNVDPAPECLDLLAAILKEFEEKDPYKLHLENLLIRRGDDELLQTS
jgi:hypothetical protein